MDEPLPVQQGVLVRVVRAATSQKGPHQRRLSCAGGAGEENGPAVNPHHPRMDEDKGPGVLGDEELQVTLEGGQRPKVS